MTKNIFIVFLFCSSFFAFAQDTLTVMQYNLLYYGQNTSFCSSTNNNLDKKDTNLRIILGHVKPDVFCVNEMGSKDSLATRILNRDLNIDGVNFYKRAAFTKASGSSIVNMIFYDSFKLTLVKQELIDKDTSGNALERVIDLYSFYYNDKNLSTSNDTVFITFIVAHLKAGSTSSDKLQREQETAALMKFIKGRKTENYIFSGDFNLNSSNELSYQNLINESNIAYRFYDPVQQNGTWYNDSAFSNYHTQSTHTVSNCFAGSGLDDRLDFILASDYVMNDSAKVKYVPGSYTTIGQDGMHFDQNVNSGINTSAPVEVINALYSMSDHLPVSLRLAFSVTPVSTSITKTEKEEKVFIKNPVEEHLIIKVNRKEHLPVYVYIYSLTGKLIYKKELSYDGKEYILNDNNFSPSRGLYLLKITDSSGFIHTAKIVKH